MTNDYKNVMAQYLTNTVYEGAPGQSPTFKESNTYNKNITSAIEEMFGTTINTLDYEILTSEATDNIVLYGNFYYYSSGSYLQTYFIAVLDRDYNVLFISNKYSSGTDLSPLIKLAYDEEGKLYGLDEYGTTNETGSTTPRYRLILLNNVAVPNQEGNYEITLRKTYIFPNGYNKLENFFQIGKAQDKSIYYILSNDYGYGGSYGRVVSLKINVGSANEWYTTQLLYGISNDDDLLIEPYNDDYILYYTSTMLGYTNFVYWVKGSPVVRIDYFNIEAGGIKIISSAKFSFININTNDDTWNFYLYDNGNLKLLDSGSLYVYDNVKTYYVNGLIFYCLIYSPYHNGYGAIVGCYDGTNYNNNEITLIEVTNLIESKTMVKNNYGLYTVDCICMQNNNDIIWNNKIIYFPGLYSGDKYININSLIPQSCEIYNNNNIIFARNLYNSTINENQTNSTIVIPNAFLNDIQLTKQNLLSQTNSQIVSNEETITKNIYEALFLNFINTINVKDQDNNIMYPLSAIYINNNINVGTKENCQNTYIGKIRVNKGEDTFITPITWSGSVNNSIREANFCITFDTDISSIDFISNDETTTYYSIDTSSWETGKTYLINQYLKVE